MLMTKIFSICGDFGKGLFGTLIKKAYVIFIQIININTYKKANLLK